MIARSSLQPPDALAGAGLLREVSQAVAALESLAQRQPELWTRFARRSVQWPMLVTLNPRITQSQKEVLRSLELGRDPPLSINPKSRTSTEDAATRYALSIIMTLQDNRDSWASLTRGTAPPWVKAAATLPPFDKRTWHSWWLVGKQAFLETERHPEDIGELNKLAHAKTTPGEKRALILERIARAMRSLAPAGTAAPPLR